MGVTGCGGHARWVTQGGLHEVDHARWVTQGGLREVGHARLVM